MKYAAYVRYSSDNQREESIDAQLRAIREYADRMGHILVQVYADEARSATTDNRPKFQKMIQDSEHGLFECIIVHKLDRFSRDRYDSAHYKRILKRNKVRLISVLENIDDSPESIILESVLEGMAEYYSRNLAREVMKGMCETAYKCRHTGGIPPLGYDVNDDKTYSINISEAEAVKLIFNMYIAGYGYSKILYELAIRDYKTKTGKPFGKNSLYSILSNEKYAGVFVFNKTERKIAGKRNGHRHKSDDEIIRVPGGMPAIISIDTWEEVNKKMQSNKHTQASYRAKTMYLLSGHIICGECNGSMLGKHGRTGRNKEEYAYYECGTRKRTKTCSAKAINRDLIEDIVINELYEKLFSPEIIDIRTDEIFKYIQSQKSEAPEYIAKASKKLAAIDLEIKHIVDAIAKGMYHESMKKKMDELESQKAMLNIRINEASREQQIYKLTYQNIHDYLGQWTTIRTMTPELQRKAIDEFVERIIVHHDHVHIVIFKTPDLGGEHDTDPPDGTAPPKDGNTLSTKDKKDRGTTPVRNKEGIQQKHSVNAHHDEIPVNAVGIEHDSPRLHHQYPCPHGVANMRKLSVFNCLQARADRGFLLPAK